MPQILDLEISQEINGHGRLVLCGGLKEDEKPAETIQAEGTRLKLGYREADGTPHEAPLFDGLIEKVHIFREGGFSRIILSAVSGSWPAEFPEPKVDTGLDKRYYEMDGEGAGIPKAAFLYRMVEDAGNFKIGDLTPGLGAGFRICGKKVLWSDIKSGWKKKFGNKEDTVRAGSGTPRKYTDSQIDDILKNIRGDGFKNNPLRQEYEKKVYHVFAKSDNPLECKKRKKKGILEMPAQRAYVTAEEYRNKRTQVFSQYPEVDRFVFIKKRLIYFLLFVAGCIFRLEYWA